MPLDPTAAAGLRAEGTAAPGRSVSNPAEIRSAGKVKVVLKTWFKTWSFAAWEGEIPVADWAGVPLCTVYGPGSGAVCRTPVPTERANGATRDFAGRLRVLSSGEPIDVLEIVDIELLDGEVGVEYPDQQFEARGMFSDTVAWRIVEGGIPGITLDSSTGVLSGTPTLPGTYELAVAAWYGPVPDDAAEPPIGPPSPRFVQTVNIEGGCLPEVLVSNPGDDGSGVQIRNAIAAVCDGATVWLLATDVGDEIDHLHIDLVKGELVVASEKTVTLSGTGDVSIRGDGEHRVFHLERGADVTMHDITIVDGVADFGGGVWAEPTARLRLTGGTAIVGYSATISGGGVFLSPPLGDGDGATLEMYDESTILINTASKLGGGVFSFGGTVSIVDSAWIYHNIAGLHGGGIAAVGGSITLSGTSLIWSNTAAEYGGGIHISDFGGTSPLVTLNDSSTIVNNTAGAVDGGGGIYQPAGTVILNDNSAVYDNTPDDIQPPLL